MHTRTTLAAPTVTNIICYNQAMSQQYHQRRRPKHHNHRKRQTTNNELFLTVLVIGVFALVASAMKVSDQVLPVLATALVLIVATSVAVISVLALRKNQKLRAIQLSGVDVMDGFVFEKYVAELLKHQGFHNVKLTEKYDLGIDAIADKDGEKWGIQIKRNRGKTKAESVRQAVTALNHYKCTRAMVVSNSQFTGAARQLADSNRCILIDRQQLGNWIFAYQHRS